MQYAAGFLVFLLGWWGGSLLAGPVVLPRPTSVFVYLLSPGVLPQIFSELSLTLVRALAGFTVAVLIALPVGILMGRRQSRRRMGFFPVLMLQSAPPLFWITPLVLWLGTRGSVPVVVAFLVTLPLLTIHTMMAIRHIADWEYDVFTVYAPRRLVVARELYMPHLLPALKSNAHLGMLVAIKAAMLGEWFAAQDGFGRAVRVYYQYFAMREFVGWAFVFLLVVGGISFGLEILLKRTLPEFRRTDAADNDRPAATSSAAGTSRADALAHRGDTPDRLGQTPGRPGQTPGRPGVTPSRPGQTPGRADASEPAPPETQHSPGPTAERPALSVSGLTFGFDRAPLFSEVSFSLPAGESVVLYGESGCGKTTLLRCISGILTPWTGEITTRGSVGMVFQDDALLAHRDALGNVLLPAMPSYTAADAQRARNTLSLWGLGGHEGTFPHELSGGMRKRLAMARAWFLEPSVLLLDEPFVNLDREARTSLWDLLFVRLRETGMSAIIVTHYPEELERFQLETKSWDALTGTGDAKSPADG